MENIMLAVIASAVVFCGFSCAALIRTIKFANKMLKEIVESRVSKNATLTETEQAAIKARELIQSGLDNILNYQLPKTGGGKQ